METYETGLKSNYSVKDSAPSEHFGSHFQSVESLEETHTVFSNIINTV